MRASSLIDSVVSGTFSRCDKPKAIAAIPEEEDAAPAAVGKEFELSISTLSVNPVRLLSTEIISPASRISSGRSGFPLILTVSY
jgi:hypothetical protein